MYSRSEFDDDDMRREAIDERRVSRHWCDTCHGHTGPDSPCYSGPDPEPEEEPEPEGEEE